MTKYHRITPSKSTMSRSGGRHIGLLLLCLCVLVNILQLVPQTIIGPILAIVLLFTYFVLNETILATVIIVFINDGLGIIVGEVSTTTFGTSLSFSYLLLIFIFYELFFCKSASTRSMLLTLLALVLCGQLSLMGDIAWRQTIFAVIYTLALIVQYMKFRNDADAFFNKLCSALAVTYALVSIHTLIKGGVEFYEQNEYAEEFLRKGVIGAGNGDSNFSGLALCTGIIGTLNSKSLHLIQKAIIFFLISASITVTLSVTAVLLLSVILLLHATIGKKAHKALVVLLVVVLILVVLYNVYITLPADQRNDTMDAYIERVTAKFNAFFDGNYNTATTNRSHLAQRYQYYLFHVQNISKLLFGGNSIMVLGPAPHNTYLDWILQFGMVGFLALLFLIAKRLLSTYKLPADTSYRRALLSLKTIYLLGAFTLSIINGSSFAALCFFVFVL